MVATAVINPIVDNALGGAVVAGAASMSIAWSNPSTADYVDISSGDTPSVVMNSWVAPNALVQGSTARLFLNVETIVGIVNQPPLTASFTRAGLTVATTISLLAGSSPGPFLLRPAIEVDTSTWYQHAEQGNVGFENVLLSISNPGACTYRIYSMWLEFDVVTFPTVTMLSPQGLQYLNAPAFRFTYEQEDEARLNTVNIYIFSDDQYAAPGFNFTSHISSDLADNIVPPYVYSDIAMVGANVIGGSSGQSLPSTYTVEQSISITVRSLSWSTPATARGNLLPGKYRAYLILQYEGGFYYAVDDYAEFEVAEYVRPPLEESTLGCGEYIVQVQDRGGDIVRAYLPWSSIFATRLVDEAGTGTITVAKREVDAQCAGILATILPWQHEIAIYRNKVLIFVGPLVDFDEDDDFITLTARDLFAWFDRRNLPYDRTLTLTDLSAIFDVYVQDALARDPSPNITLVSVGSGSPGDREIRGVDRRKAGDQLRELGRSGIDFVMDKRTLLVGSVELPLTRLPLITDAYAAPIRNNIRGLDMASEAIVVGAGGGPTTAPATGIATGDVDRFGLVQQVISEPTILDDATAQMSADNRLALLDGDFFSAPVKLAASAPIPLEMLIPGARATISLHQYIRKIEGEHRLESVRIDANTSEEGVTETVTCVFTPVGGSL